MSSTTAVDALETQQAARLGCSFRGRDLCLGMHETVTAHRRDEDGMRQLLSEDGDGGIDLLSDDASHPVGRERVIAKRAAILPEGPLIALTMGDEHIDALTELGLGFRLEEVGIDDIEVFVDAFADQGDGFVLRLLLHLRP